MERIEFVKLGVAPARILLDRRDWIKYYVIPKWYAEKFDDPIPLGDEKFAKFVEKQVSAYLKGKEPPAAILSAVMNIADRMATDGAVTLRAGDYIALQNHYRNATG